LGAVLGAGLLIAACSSDAATPFAPATGTQAEGLYWSLGLNAHAVTLSTVAPYDTITLVATPRDGRGNALSGLGTVTFRSSDSSRVQVSADGHVHALLSGDGVTVSATLTHGNLTHSDSVFFSVTDEATPPTPAHLSIQPVPPATTELSMSGDGLITSIAADGGVSGNFFSFLLSASLTDAQDTPVPGFLAALSSSDPTVAQASAFFGFYFIVPQKPGHTTIIASTTAYGVPLADTVTYTITLPNVQAVKIQPGPVTLGGSPQVGFHSADVTVVPGGTVLWINLSGQAVDVVFDDTTNVLQHGAVTDCAGQPEPPGGGNIAAFGVPQDPDAGALDPENCRSRRFPVAGTYRYHSTVTSATGRVVVSDGLSGF
jgi:plastocyanin